MIGVGIGINFSQGGGASGTHVFVLGGQSNMVGWENFDGGAGYPEGVLQYNQSMVLVPASSPLDHRDERPGSMGLALQFCIEYCAAHPGVQVVLVPCADGGTSFQANQWGVGNYLYTELVSRVNNLFTAHPEFKLGGILWHQGESDVGYAPYQSELDEQFAAFRANITVATDRTPIILGKFLPEWTSGNASRLATDAIIADTPNRVAYTAVADSAGLVGRSDGIHFNAPSLRTLGQRYLAALAVAKTNVPTLPDAPTNVSVIVGDKRLTVYWTAPVNTGKSPITDYVVERSLDGTNFATISDGVSALPDYVDTGLVNDQEYTYRVAAVNVLGTGVASETVSGTPVAGIQGVDPEAGALAHYLFGEDNPGDLDVLGRQGLTGPAPIRSAGYLTPQTGNLTGLSLPLLDRPSFTMVFVMRRPTATTYTIFGGTLFASGGTNHGWAAYFENSAMRHNELGGSGNLFVENPADFTDFTFYAVSIDAAAESRLFYRGDATAPRADLRSSLPRAFDPATAVAVGLGNVYFNSPVFSAACDFAEVLYFDGAMSAVDLEGIYARSVARLAARGITLK